jgi:hypothetical protein
LLKLLLIPQAVAHQVAGPTEKLCLAREVVLAIVVAESQDTLEEGMRMLDLFQEEESDRKPVAKSGEFNKNVILTAFAFSPDPACNQVVHPTQA